MTFTIYYIHTTNYLSFMTFYTIGKELLANRIRDNQVYVSAKENIVYNLVFQGKDDHLD